MKFLHLGDLHLGKSLGDFDLYDDQKYILNQIIDIITENQVDGLLIAGDVYDKAIPSEAATRLLDEFLCRLVEIGAKVYMISGNHDSDDRLNFGSSLFEAKDIFISSVFDGTLHKQTITGLTEGSAEVNSTSKSGTHGQSNGTEAPGEIVDIYLLPFVKASQVRHFFPEDKIETYEDAVRCILAHTELDPTHRSILVAHQFVAGQGADPVTGGSESIGTLNVGLVEKIGYDLFNQFDYVALGHIHRAQAVGRDAVRYSGSPLKYSLSEVAGDKTAPLITIEGDEPVKIELIPLKPLHDMRQIKGKLADLIDPANVRDAEDYIYATLTDEGLLDNAMGVLQQVYPRTLSIGFENSHSQELTDSALDQEAQQMSFDELISSFYQNMYGCEMSEEELKVMQEVAEEAGISDATN